MPDQRLESTIIDSNTTEILAAPTSSDLDVMAGDAVTDIAIEGLSKQISDSSTEIVDAENIIALDRPTQASTVDFDQKAKNYLTTRNPATYAIGQVTFYKRFAPVTTYTIPIGSIISTYPDSKGNSISFTTTSVGVINTLTPINPLTRRWEVTVSVVANVIGLAGVAGRNSVTRLLVPISGIDGVFNSQAISSGAVDEETNTALATRIRSTKTTKSDIGTRTGYQTLILSVFPSVIALDVVGPTDPANSRAEFGNEIDIYIEGQNPTAFSDYVLYDGATTTYLQTRPTLDVSSIVGTTITTVFVKNVDWQFVQDTSPAYGYSTKSLDKVTWIGVKPIAGQGISLSGIYDKNVVDIQAYLIDPTRRVVATNLLMKDGKEILIDVHVRISVLGGFDRNTIVTNCKAAVISYIDSLVLGSVIEQADLVSVIGNVAGVDEVQIPFVQLKTSTEPPLTVHDITLSKSQFPKTNQPTLVIEAI